MKHVLLVMLIIGLVACDSGASSEVTPEASPEATAQVSANTLNVAYRTTLNTVAQQSEEAEATEEAAEEGVEAPVLELNVDALTPAEYCEAAVPAADPDNREYTQPDDVLEAGVDYRAIFCTDAGAIYIDLLEDYSPITVNNFVFLAQNDFYNNTIFHRVIESFMAQGGDPLGTGTGGPGYQFPDEFASFLTFNKPGWLAMANANNPEQGIVGTNGSQFFITTVPTTHLDYRHTIFGEVLEGQDNVLNITIRDPQQAGSPATTLQTVLIVTDPSTVATSYVAPEKATLEEISGILDVFATTTPADISITTEVFETVDDVVASVAEEAQEGYGDFLATYDHQFQVDSLVDNTACNEDYAFSTLGYQLDAFASAEEASAALASGFFGELAIAEGFVPVENVSVLGGGLYTKDTEYCDEASTQGRIIIQRGRFISTVESVIPSDRQYGVDAVIEQFAAHLYELTLADVLVRELR